MLVHGFLGPAERQLWDSAEHLDLDPQGIWPELAPGRKTEVQDFSNSPKRWASGRESVCSWWCEVVQRKETKSVWRLSAPVPEALLAGRPFRTWWLEL